MKNSKTSGKYGLQSYEDPLLDCLIEACPGDSSNEASPASCSNRALVPCSNPEISDDVPLTNQTVVDTASAASGTENQFLIKGVGTESETHVPVRPVVISSVVTEPGNHLFFNAVDTVSAETESDYQLSIFAIIFIGFKTEFESMINYHAYFYCLADCSPVGNLALGENHGSSPRLVASLCNKRRRPCYGWISSDDDEELTVITRSKVSDMLANDGVN
ncbi:hypothetical protein RJT34_22881 [Clitoria ternatea]|uniref:Uncharacterized protein n=1 Tax=Clitoria ternatea TaxID=43366 RepID=A0AAN9FJX5_CLITE